MPTEDNFSKRVESLVSLIPEGRLMTYGQIAAICGNAQAARVVGGIAHFGDPNIPWHRVVNKKGGLAAGYPGGKAAHKHVLELENIEVDGQPGSWFVDVNGLLWHP